MTHLKKNLFLWCVNSDLDYYNYLCVVVGYWDYLFLVIMDMT